MNDTRSSGYISVLTLYFWSGKYTMYTGYEHMVLAPALIKVLVACLLLQEVAACEIFRFLLTVEDD
jgi:hypothetical protein